MEAHPAEFAYDFRSRFNLSFEAIGSTVSLLEAVYLVAMLLRDPTSWLQAAHRDWKNPVSQEWMITANTYDLLMKVNSKTKPKPYPRPWPADNVSTIGSNQRLSRATVLERLESMNPKED